MATLDPGNAECTSGLSKLIFDELMADVRNGFSNPITTDQINNIKAICFSVAKGVADQINAGGGVGAAGLTGSGTDGQLAKWLAGGLTNSGLSVDTNGRLVLPTGLVFPGGSQLDAAPDLSLYAPLNSPLLTGMPTAPTPPLGDTSTRIATMEALADAVAVGGVVPSDATPLADGTGSAGTFEAYSRGDHRHPTDSTRAPLDSPIFTGVPTAPTPPAGDTSTRLATMEALAAAVATAGSGIPTRRTRRIFEAYYADTTFKSDFNGSQKWVTNNGGASNVSVDTTQPIPALHLFQSANTTYWSVLDSATNKIIYTSHRPKLSCLAKFGTWSKVHRGFGWVQCSPASATPWTRVVYGGAANSYGASFNCGDGGNWRATCWVGDGAAATTVDTGVSAIDGKWHLFEIDWSTESQIVFWIDRTVVATITSNLPTDPSNTGCVIGCGAQLDQTGGQSEVWVSYIDLETDNPMGV